MDFDEQLPEVAAFEHAQESLGSIGQPLHDVLPIADRAASDAGADFLEEVGIEVGEVVVVEAAQRERTNRYGATVLLIGVALAVNSLSYHSATQFFLGTALAGSGFGTGFRGAIRCVVPLAAPQERGGVLSVIFVVSYLAMGLPAVIAGYFVAR